MQQRRTSPATAREWQELFHAIAGEISATHVSELTIAQIEDAIYEMENLPIPRAMFTKVDTIYFSLMNHLWEQFQLKNLEIEEAS